MEDLSPTVTKQRGSDTTNKATVIKKEKPNTAHFLKESEIHSNVKKEKRKNQKLKQAKSLF